MTQRRSPGARRLRRASVGPVKEEATGADPPGLAQPVAAVLRLLVVVRVTVDVVEDDGVGRRQVDAQAAGARRQQEHEDVRVVVVLVYQHYPVGGSACVMGFHTDPFIYR